MEKRQVVGLGRTAEILAWDKTQVLKLFRHGWSLSAVEWEENVARTVSDAGLPVPAVYGITEVDGRHGIIYERVDGPSMLEALTAKPEELEHFASLFAELHVQMHFLQIRGLPSQRQQLKKMIRTAKPLSKNWIEVALRTLDKLPNGNVLCHGDFHPDNIQMSTRGPVVIDWNVATRGNPVADIARTLLLLQQGEPIQPIELGEEQIQSMRNSFVNIYLRRYSQIKPLSLEDVESWRLPITSARLSEGIKEEENRLLVIIENCVRNLC